MRSLVVLFFFFVLMFGVGTVILSTEVSGNPGTSNINYSLGQIAAGNQPDTAISTEVDRDDDSETIYDCSPAPNDCNLRSAILIANKDGKPTSITFASSYLIRVSQPLPALTENNTVIKAMPGQEVHIDGSGTAASVLRITGAHVAVQGLRIYGAGAGYPNIAISENAFDVIIAHNVIGDDDAPKGNCGSSDFAYSGIYVDAVGEFDDGARAWIYGNVIECNRGIPGDGITIRSDRVIVGKDHFGAQNDTMRNTVHLNKGFGVNLTNATGNTVCDNSLTANEMGGLYISNFDNNNIMFNDIVDNGNIVN